jgi:serine/threonine protein kinase
LAYLDEAERNVVKFYGSFEQANIKTIVLEYADRGTLQEHFRTIPSPQSEQDITNFWAKLLGLARALTQVHDVDIRDGQPHDSFHG